MADELPPALPASPARPRLSPANHKVTSPRSAGYNCIAWAAGDESQFWWPDHKAAGYWPADIPREETIEAFVAVFGTLGYTPCADAAAEPGYQKVALYAFDGAPTHAARQLPGGRWSSKLGRGYDIEHDLDALDGPVYGAPAVFLRRPLTPPET